MTVDHGLAWITPDLGAGLDTVCREPLVDLVEHAASLREGNPPLRALGSPPC
jgi:hypothetical protein